MRRFMTPVIVTATAATTVALAAAPALADREPSQATGISKLTLTRPTIDKLSTGGCGLPTVTPVGNASVKPTGKTVQVLLPVTRLVLKDNHADAIQVQHDNSGVVLENSCYRVKLTSFTLQNFEDPDQLAGLEVEARTAAEGESGRKVLFTLDLTGAVSHTSDHRGNYTKQRISSAALELADAGAAELNRLVGESEATGPFSPTDQLGAAKTQVKYAS